MLTPDQLSAIRKRADAATPGPWVSHHVNSLGVTIGSYTVPGFGFDDIGRTTWDGLTSNNHDFMAYARDDIPALLDEVERLKSENDDLRSQVNSQAVSIEVYVEDIAQLQADKRELVVVLRDAVKLWGLGQRESYYSNLYEANESRYARDKSDEQLKQHAEIIAKIDAAIAKHGGDQ